MVSISHKNDISARFKGTIYPDGTFSVGCCSCPKKRVDETRYDVEYKEQFDSYEYEVIEYGKRVVKTYEFIPKQPPPLGLSSLQNHHKSTLKYGSKGITAYGRKLVSNSALLLQQQYTKNRLGFGTATLPPLTKSGLTNCLKKWGDITRQFFQEIKRVLGRSGVEFLYVSCTEIQSIRFKRTGMPYPHLHWVYVAKASRNSPWHISSSLIRTIWRRILINKLGAESFINGVTQKDFNATIDTQGVKKSASRYLSKYLSKGTETTEAMQEAGFEYFPSQWWSASMQTKKMYRESLVRIHAKLAQDLFMYIEKYAEVGIVTWWRDIWGNYKGQERRFGCVGKFCREAHLTYIENSCIHASIANIDIDIPVFPATMCHLPDWYVEIMDSYSDSSEA